MGKLFTIKDFITYNAPCFNCHSKINFITQSVKDVESMSDVILNQMVELKPTITSQHMEIDLVITYRTNTKLSIDLKINKFSTNNTQGLKRYLDRHKLFLISQCDSCHSQIVSQFLRFDFNKGYVKAFGLWHERLIVDAGNQVPYQINTWFDKSESILFISCGTEYMKNIKLPLMPKYKFKDKQALIDKCHLYGIFL
jgi:hypothetical protein